MSQASAWSERRRMRRRRWGQHRRPPTIRPRRPAQATQSGRDRAREGATTTTSTSVAHPGRGTRSSSNMSATAESDREEYCRLEEEEEEEDEGNRPPASWPMAKKRLSKQMSMKDTTRERAWIRRKRQVMMQRMEAEAVAGRGGRGGTSSSLSSSSSSFPSSSSPYNRGRRERNRDLTDEDLDELKGFMDLGFRFTEMDGCEDLRIMLPALDLLFAVKRQYSDSKLQYTPSPVSTPTTARSQRSSPSPLGSPTSRTPNPNQSVAADSWKIVEPGDNPQHIKTKLRHWAQAVACSVRDLPNSS